MAKPIEKPNFLKTEAELQAVIDQDLKFLTIYYVEVGLLTGFFLKDNSKLHDRDLLQESAERHGFKQPIKFDKTLHGGKGGIQAGNNRLDYCKMLAETGEAPPEGILIDNGKYYAPVSFGVNDATEQDAIAYSITDNISVFWGSDTGIEEQVVIFEEDTLVNKQLIPAANIDVDLLPVGIDGDDLDTLIETDEDQGGGNGDSLPQPGDQPKEELDQYWGVLIRCESEDQQVGLLERLQKEGLEVKALM